MADKIIMVPGVGTVQFPGDMSDDQINAELMKTAQPNAGLASPGAPPKVQMQEQEPSAVGAFLNDHPAAGGAVNALSAFASRAKDLAIPLATGAGALLTGAGQGSSISEADQEKLKSGQYHKNIFTGAVEPSVDASNIGQGLINETNPVNPVDVASIQKGEYGKAAGNTAANALALLVGHKMSRGMQATESPTVTNSTQVENLAGSLPRSQKVDPYAVADKALPEMRQSVAEMGGDIPKDTKSGVLQASQVAQHAIDRNAAEFDQIRKPYADQTVQGRPIADKIRALGEKYPEQERNAINAMAKEYDKDFTVDELNKERLNLNKQTNSLLSRNQSGQIAAGISDQVNRVAANATRDALYGRVEELSGQDLRPLKQNESGLIALKDGLVKAENTAKSKQAQAASTTLLDKIRGRGMTAIEKNDMFQRVFGLSPADEFNGKITRAMGGVDAPDARPTYTLNKPPIAGLLPASSESAELPTGQMSGYSYEAMYPYSKVTAGQDATMTVSSPRVARQAAQKAQEYTNTAEFQGLDSTSKSFILDKIKELQDIASKGDAGAGTYNPGTLSRSQTPVNRSGIKMSTSAREALALALAAQHRQ